MINKKISKIADEKLNIKTLKTRNSDSLDFHIVSVWGIKEALEAAYELGKKEMKMEIKGKIEGFDPHEYDLSACQNNMTSIYSVVTK